MDIQVESLNSKAVEWQQQTERDSRVFELRIQGFTFERIAREVGFSGPSGAWQAYQRIREQMIFEPLEELRQLELIRLDEVQHALWGRVVNGDLPAAHCVLKIMDQRAKLVGLYKSEKVEVNKWDYQATDIDTEVQRIITMMNEREDEFVARREGEVRAEMRAQFELERRLEKQMSKEIDIEEAKRSILAFLDEGSSEEKVE